MSCFFIIFSFSLVCVICFFICLSFLLFVDSWVLCVCDLLISFVWIEFRIVDMCFVLVLSFFICVRVWFFLVIIICLMLRFCNVSFFNFDMREVVIFDLEEVIWVLSWVSLLLDLMLILCMFLNLNFRFCLNFFSYL